MDPEDFVEVIARARDWDFENETIDDSFTEDREVDFFAIEYTAGDIWLLSTNNNLGDITVFDSVGNIVFSPETGRFGPVEFDARFVGAESGTYYVQVRNSGFRDVSFPEGPYTLSASRLVDEVGDTIETATAITLEETISGEFEYKEDPDIFSLDVIAGQVLSFDLADDIGAAFRILDASGNTLSIQDSTGLESQSTVFDFIHIASQDQTIYINLNWVLRGPGPISPDYAYTFTVNDITPPTVDGTITAGGPTFTGTIDGETSLRVAVDYTAGDVVKVDVSGGRVTIFDSEGNIVDRSEGLQNGSISNDNLFLAGLETGDYFIEVEIFGAPVSTTINISAALFDDDHGNRFEDATELVADGTRIVGTDEYDSDVDTFVINVNENETLNFDIESTSGIFGEVTVLTLWDAEGNSIDIDGDSFLTESFSYISTFTGSLFIRANISPVVRGPDGLGDYAFTVTTTPILNIIDGTDDNDTLHGTSSTDDIAGLGGDDKLFSLGGDDKLFGGDGNDVLHAGAGDDELFGEAGNDRLYGITGDDYLEGGAGHDLLLGGDGQDSLFGGENNDRLFGGVGNDFLSGGEHNDVLSGEDGDDSLFGDAGADRLLGGQGHDYLSGGLGNDKLFGGADNDVLDGDAGQDVLYGQDGADTLNGGASSDILFGGSGNDYLDGGTGNDVLSGGDGADVFRYESNSGVDRIVDFDLYQDKVDFSNGLIAFQDFDDLMDHAVQIGDDLHLIAGDGNRLVLEDINIHDIDADLFIFV